MNREKNNKCDHQRLERGHQIYRVDNCSSLLCGDDCSHLLAVQVMRAELYTAWILAGIYISALGLAFMLRYGHGKWKKMRVIEAQPLVAEVRCGEM